MNPKGNNVLVETLGSSLKHGGESLSAVPDLLKRVIREEAWRDFETRMGKRVRHARFAEFVTTSPLDGLGASLDLVRRVVSGDAEAMDLLDKALQNPEGRPQTNNNIISNSDTNPQGTSAARALRRLRKDRPDLHSDVVRGNLSPHAAMVKAGFRPRTFTVRADDAESAARTIRKNMNKKHVAALVKLLSTESGDHA